MQMVFVLLVAGDCLNNPLAKSTKTAHSGLVIIGFYLAGGIAKNRPLRLHRYVVGVNNFQKLPGYCRYWRNLHT